MEPTTPHSSVGIILQTSPKHSNPEVTKVHVYLTYNPKCQYCSHDIANPNQTNLTLTQPKTHDLNEVKVGLLSVYNDL